MNDKVRRNQKSRVWIRHGDPLVERERPWDTWSLDKENWTLDLVPPGYKAPVYSVHLDTCNGRLGGHKWVSHLAHKLGGAYWTADVMGHFVWALRDLRILPHIEDVAQSRNIAQLPHKP